ncbi:hypothetical protein NEFER03_1660 [Nematocida sp. LUAm3]|nr:hypothetical protein NEFER03_1660 [Nematocida sp. LUAm3]KAI5174684.1 hypothetical protein NEFER02_0794 [Nematocida sp. LUAm2]KAI5177905.1 hypothetical protein NEFER01_1107 [Nematocida sp. LUAm1]
MKQDYLLVFDLNGTLMKRVKENAEKYLKVRDADGYVPRCANLLYIRPHIKELSVFLHENKINYIFWTTAMEHNAVHLVNLVKKHGMNREIGAFYHSSATKVPDHEYKRYKDLSIISEKFSVPVERIFLIDDEEYKCFPSSSHIPIDEYDPLDEKDFSLISLISTIKEKLKIE